MGESVLEGGPCYDAMPAGRELDALVAEKVMGWRLVAERPVPSFGVSTTGQRSPRIFIRNPTIAACAAGYNPSAGTPVISGHWVSATGFEQNEDWSPSTDIAAAWQVVERMNQVAKDAGGQFSITKRDVFGKTYETKEEALGFGIQFNTEHWEAGFVQTNGGGHEPDYIGWPSAEAPTAPLAICIAALIAVHPPAR